MAVNLSPKGDPVLSDFFRNDDLGFWDEIRVVPEAPPEGWPRAFGLHKFF